MKLPIDQTKISALVIGDPKPVLIYGTAEQRSDQNGRPLFRVPILISGTPDSNDPTTTVTIPGPIDSITKGQTIRFRALTIATWVIRDAGGRERHGFTLRADGIEGDSKPSR